MFIAVSLCKEGGRFMLFSPVNFLRSSPRCCTWCCVATCGVFVFSWLSALCGERWACGVFDTHSNLSACCRCALWRPERHGKEALPPAIFDGTPQAPYTLHIQSCTHTHMRTCKHEYMHAHTHTHTHTLSLSLSLTHSLSRDACVHLLTAYSRTNTLFIH